MPLVHPLRRILAVVTLILVLVTTSACGAVDQSNRTAQLPKHQTTLSYDKLEHGDTAVGQDFGNWVLQTAQGLVKDAYVRGNDKLGVVITPQVRPAEVRPLARSLAQGFHHNVPNRDLTVLMYAPDKKLILTAKYDNSANQIQYE